MRIAYLLPYFTIVSGSFGGIKMQAVQWRDMLQKMGHEVVEINPWETYDWKSFDVIHFFFFGSSFFSLYSSLKQRAPQAKFVCSPVLDPHYPLLVYKVLSRISYPKAKIFADYSALRRYKSVFDVFLARTQYEQKFLSDAFGISPSKIQLVPLNSRFSKVDSLDQNKKENFCLHVSRICDSTKNVERLVDAALKYNFDLVLAGASTDEFNAKLARKIGSRQNIQNLGRVSDEKLKDLYSRAKVFALPSIREGVGLVALEAASYDCDIVITNIGGPKEYFLPNAIAVDPYSVDEIGLAVKRFLDGETYQPALRKLIAEKYSEPVVTQKLLDAYSRM